MAVISLVVLGDPRLPLDGIVHILLKGRSLGGDWAVRGGRPKPHAGPGLGMAGWVVDSVVDRVTHTEPVLACQPSQGRVPLGRGGVGAAAVTLTKVGAGGMA